MCWINSTIAATWAGLGFVGVELFDDVVAGGEVCPFALLRRGLSESML
jgi:hypothetical protein